VSNPLRKLLKLPITLPLRFPFIRRRVAFELRPWFGDLKYEIPLTEGLACPLGSWDAVHSFSEIFVTGEYGDFLGAMPLPRRWLDLGCHAGYFTLYLAWKNAIAGVADWSALLIDADPRMEAQVSWTLERNRLGKNARFMPALIGEAGAEKNFALRDGMGSSADAASAPADSIRRLKCVGAEQIAKAFPPPYDLIKIDIEGAEYDFVRNYPELCREASHLLVEWHSDGADGRRQAELRELCAGAGFEHAGEMRPRRKLCVDGVWSSYGIDLYRRIRA